MFTGWIPETPGFGYVFDPNETTYSGKWHAPYSTTNLQIVRNLIDPAMRYRYFLYGNSSPGVPFPYSGQIVHQLIPRLTAQRAGFKPTDSYASNVINGDGTSGDLNSGKNTLDNAAMAEITIEWLPSPQNGYGINGAWVDVKGEGSFDEIGEAETIVTYLTSGSTNSPGGAGVFMEKTVGASGPYLLQKPLSINSPTDKITVTYDWVERGLVDLSLMTAIRGTINYWDVGMWAAGTLLYEGSDISDSISPLGYSGYKIVHHFSSKPRDWNLVPIIPKPVTFDTAATGTGVNEVQLPDFDGFDWGWATMRPPYNSTVTSAPTFAIGASNKYDHARNRKYKYSPFIYNRLDSPLFYYGLASTAPTPETSVNPNTATATPPSPPTLS